MPVRDDICQYAGVGRLSEALRLINLCGDHCTGECRVEETSDWYQSGSETYCLEWAVLHADGHRDALIAKACVSLGGGLSEKVGEWTARRTALSGRGVTVPRLAFVYKATIYEEFVPLEFIATLKSTDDGTRAAMLDDLMKAARAAESLGFRTLPIHDARTHGTDFVVIDFGQDLGGRSRGAIAPGSVVTQVLSELQRVGVQVL